jgi:hypothetical protein
MSKLHCLNNINCVISNDTRDSLLSVIKVYDYNFVNIGSSDIRFMALKSGQ